MEEKKGHFEKGRWVDDIPAPEENKEKERSKSNTGENAKDNIDKIIAETADSVKTAVDSVINLGNTLLGTKEGRSEIEKKAKNAGKIFLKSLEDALEDAKKNL